MTPEVNKDDLDPEVNKDDLDLDLEQGHGQDRCRVQGQGHG